MVSRRPFTSSHHLLDLRKKRGGYFSQYHPQNLYSKILCFQSEHFSKILKVEDILFGSAKLLKVEVL